MNTIEGEALPEATKKGLERLRLPFPPNQVLRLPRNTKTGVIQLSYVGHAALTDRLLDVDPLWHWEPISLDKDGLPMFDAIGGLWIRLHLLGTSRLGYGSAGDKTGGDAIKECIGDALRNAAMRFGCALDLWHKGVLHMDAPSGGETEDVDKGLRDATIASLQLEAKKGVAALRIAWTGLDRSDRALLSREDTEELRLAAEAADKTKEGA